jgi:hypothetical protein
VETVERIYASDFVHLNRWHRASFTFGVLLLLVRHQPRSAAYSALQRHEAFDEYVQQLREAFPFGSPARFLIFDRDAKYGSEVLWPFDF